MGGPEKEIEIHREIITSISSLSGSALSDRFEEDGNKNKNKVRIIPPVIRNYAATPKGGNDRKEEDVMTPDLKEALEMVKLSEHKQMDDLDLMTPNLNDALEMVQRKIDIENDIVAVMDVDVHIGVVIKYNDKVMEDSPQNEGETLNDLMDDNIVTSQ